MIIRLKLKNWVDTVLDCFGVRVDFIGVVTPIIRSRMGREWVENGVENGVESRLSDEAIDRGPFGRLQSLRTIWAGFLSLRSVWAGLQVRRGYIPCT